MKREKILEAGFKLFKQKGYYKTNTAEIDKEAGVSTCIVYRYFTDKKAIFIESMEQFFHEVYNIFIDNIKTINSSSELPEYLNSTIDYAISISDITKDVHEEIEALSHYDEDVNKMCNKNNPPINFGGLFFYNIIFSTTKTVTQANAATVTKLLLKNAKITATTTPAIALYILLVA
ncbi:MAG: TetR/AcrR family transcriptional regulator [Clostridium sp.]|nr:TetR/AcrR family transcriptional regulator [Clostridium sp.]